MNWIGLYVSFKHPDGIGLDWVSKNGPMSNNSGPAHTAYGKDKIHSFI